MSLGNHDVFEPGRVAGCAKAHITTFAGLELAVLAEVVPLKSQNYRSDTYRRHFAIVEDMFESPRNEDLRYR